jgi:hypothetical protein
MFSTDGEKGVESNDVPIAACFTWQQTVRKNEAGGYGVIVSFDLLVPTYY